MANKQKRKRRFGLGGGRHAAKRKKSNGHGGRHKKTIPTDECAHFQDESRNRDAIKNQANASDSDEETSNELKDRHMAVPSISRKIQTIFYKTNGIWKSKELSKGKPLDTENTEENDMHTHVNADSQNRKMVTEEATKALSTKRINRSKIQNCKRHKRSKLLFNENIACYADSAKARSHSKKHIKGAAINEKRRKAVTILVNKDLVPNSMDVMSSIDTGANEKVVKPHTDTSAQPKIAKPPSVSVKLEDYKDSYCTEEFVSVDPMLEGKPVNEKQFTRYLCKLCNDFRTESTDALEMHISLHVNTKLNCHTCGFVANTKQKLACHVKKEHKTHRYIICEYCGYELYSGHRYKEHLSKRHNKAAFECDTCELSFFTSNDYRQHKLRTHPESTFKCEKCGAIYLWKIALENHQNYKIDCKVKKYTVCQYCNFKSLCKGAVKQHIKRVHFKSKIYKCSMCPYAAVGSDQLKFHTRVHLGIHPFNCELCEFTFVKKRQLISHTRTHTGEKRYKCGQCNYASAWNCQLKTHLKAHESTARCACQICNIVFKDRKCLSTHVKKVHTTNSYYGPELQLTAHWDPTCQPLLQRRLIK